VLACIRFFATVRSIEQKSGIDKKKAIPGMERPLTIACHMKNFNRVSRSRQAGRVRNPGTGSTYFAAAESAAGAAAAAESTGAGAVVSTAAGAAVVVSAAGSVVSASLLQATKPRIARARISFFIAFSFLVFYTINRHLYRGNRKSNPCRQKKFFSGNFGLQFCPERIKTTGIT
jgi:hypothetical protein